MKKSFFIFLIILFPCFFIQGKDKKPFTIGSNKMPRHGKNIMLPQKFLRGIYIDNVHGRNLKWIKETIILAKEAHINCFVIDIAPYQSMKPRINQRVVEELKKENIFTIARIVAFQYGLDKPQVSESYLKSIDNLVEQSLKAGFEEIQLDYIRFADGYQGLTLKEKYHFISQLLSRVKNQIQDPNILLSTDVFGRIVYNKNDNIGQQLESMAQVAQVICPMVYPSHYTPDRYKVAHPYFTVRQSTIKGLNRVGKKTFIMPYIQAFKIAISPSQLGYKKYLEEQVQAVEDTAARGWIFWNARNKYEEVFLMLKEFYEKNPKNLESENPSGYQPETGLVNQKIEEKNQKYEQQN